MAKRVAVIDIGSNSVRMVIYEKTSRFAFHLLHEEKSKVRISENAYKHQGALQEVPMQRTFDALKDFLQISNSFKATKTLCVATSALRDAPNKALFLQKVKEKLKLNIRVITGEKEAYYGAIACANLLPEQTKALSVDIGGGSTEFAYIDNKNVSHTISLNLGTVRLKELFFDTNDIDGAKEYIDRELANLPELDIETLIGIGGTFRAISNAIMKNSSYPLNKLHGYRYSIDTFKNFINTILSADDDVLKSIGIKSNRFDVIKPGTLILKRLIKKLNIQNIVTSGVGVREGVYLSDLLRNSKDKFPHNYNTSVAYLIDSHIPQKQYANQLSNLSKKLFDLTQEYLGIQKCYRYELALAAKLYPSGSNVHFYSKNKHTYYLIQSALEYGFTHESITLIATLTKYAKSKLPAESHLQKYAELLPDAQTTNALSYLLSLSLALLSHRPLKVDFSLSFENETLYITTNESLYITKDAIEKLECNRAFKVIFNS
ncbi:MAG: Ppx/GppA family phosphatase [Campylobacterales bacterium]|nr:Ppx/GppA family phosphatase [Campylobacterales bacterium]